MALCRRNVCVIVVCLIIGVSLILFEIKRDSGHRFNIKPQQNQEYPAYTLDTKIDFDKYESCPPRKLSFINNTDSNRILIALPSFPGSGNTWVRHLIQELTGYYTGSAYTDKGLAANGFPGELASVNDLRKKCIVYKTHTNTAKFRKAVILIRNPLDTMKAFFNFRYGRRTAHEKKMKRNAFQNKSRQKRSHVGIASPSLFNSTTFTEHLRTNISVWKKRYIEWLQQFQERNSLVVLYENLKRNLPFELRRIAKFLKVHVRRKDIICTLKNSEGNYHRDEKKSKIDLVNLLSDKQKKLINGAVRETSDVIKRLKMSVDISQYFL